MIKMSEVKKRLDSAPKKQGRVKVSKDLSVSVLGVCLLSTTHCPTLLFSPFPWYPLFLLCPCYILLKGQMLHVRDIPRV